MSSAAPKKKSFDRGGPVWPPRSNVANDRLRGGLGGLCPPSQKPGGLGGSAPQPKFFEKTKKQNVFWNPPFQIHLFGRGEFIGKKRTGEISCRGRGRGRREGEGEREKNGREGVRGRGGEKRYTKRLFAGWLNRIFIGGSVGSPVLVT